MTDQSQFVDAYVISTGVKQRIPRHWLADPVLGRDFAKTPSQRELDGDLPPRPAGDAKADEIDGFAEAAGIDLTGVRKNDDKLVAIEDAMRADQGGPAGDVPAPVDDPLAPSKVAHVDPEPVATDVVEPAAAPEGGSADEDEASEDYAGDAWTFQDLKDAIDARNEGRDEAHQISKGGSTDDLRERLIEDDAANAGTGTGTGDDSTTTSTDGIPPTDETPATGDKE